MNNPKYALVDYSEYLKNMKLLKVYIEGLTLIYQDCVEDVDIPDEALESLEEQIGAIQTVYDNFEHVLEDPFKGVSSDDNLN